jgi:hypothetical protein
MKRFIVVPTNPAFLGTTYGPHLYTLVPLKDEPPNCSTTLGVDAPNKGKYMHDSQQKILLLRSLCS